MKTENSSRASLTEPKFKKKSRKSSNDGDKKATSIKNIKILCNALSYKP